MTFAIVMLSIAKHLDVEPSNAAAPSSTELHRPRVVDPSPPVSARPKSSRRDPSVSFDYAQDWQLRMTFPVVMLSVAKHLGAEPSNAAAPSSTEPRHLRGRRCPKAYVGTVIYSLTAPSF
jgi:hypothetical protein